MSSSSKRILLLGAGFTTRNMGVWALTSGAITSILNAYPDAKILILDFHSESVSYKAEHPTGTKVVQMINMRFSKKFWIPNNISRLLLTALLVRLIPFQSVRTLIVGRNYWLRHIQMANFAGAISGGDSFSDIYGVERLIYVLLPQILCLVMGKPLILLPQTIGPFKSSFGKAAARYIIRRAYRVFSRDRESIQQAIRILDKNDSRVKFSYDMGFVLDPRIKQERIPSFFAGRDDKVPLVGLNVSGLLYIGGYTKKNMFGLQCDYRKLVHDIIKHFITKLNAHVMLVPHVMGTLENSESDVRACQLISNETQEELRSHLFLVEEGYDHHEIKALIGKCDFFIGSRMHACIAAISQCIPAIGLAYSKKFRGVFSSIGMDDLVIDLRDANEDSTILLLDRFFYQRIELREKLEKAMPVVLSQAKRLFFDL